LNPDGDAQSLLYGAERMMSKVLAAVRRGATLPGLHRLTTITPIARLTFALRGALVQEWIRFARNELRRQAVTARYTLRGSSIAIFVRHHSSDVMVLDEVASAGDYEPPPKVAAVLARRSRPLSVLDLGANAGYFGAWLSIREPDARIVAYEPDPGNAELVRRTIAANGASERWTLVEACAATADGMVRFAAGRGSSSRLAAIDAPDAIDIPARDVLPELAQVAFGKVDIEGAEWEILRDPRLAAAGPAVLVVEYHGEHGRAANEAEQLLRAAGYEVALHPEKLGAPGIGIIWGWRQEGSATPASNP
jgi:FkbM family methyltransferase